MDAKIPGAADVLRALANGTDPLTGGPLSDESALQRPDVIRALYAALDALGPGRDPARRRRTNAERSLPAAAGAAWTKEEADRLVAGFEAGRTIEEMAQEHQRTRGGIRSRLVKLGKIDPDAYRLP
jgi:hypothetical protein